MCQNTHNDYVTSWWDWREMWWQDAGQDFLFMNVFLLTNSQLKGQHKLKVLLCCSSSAKARSPPPFITAWQRNRLALITHRWTLILEWSTPYPWLRPPVRNHTFVNADSFYIPRNVKGHGRISPALSIMATFLPEFWFLILFWPAVQVPKMLRPYVML